MWQAGPWLIGGPAMDVSLCVASKIDDIDYVVRAEELGYRAAWFADSQMIWSDAYACLALAATRTSAMRLGTGVSVVGTRIAPVTAASLGTITRLDPWRTFRSIGAINYLAIGMSRWCTERGEYVRPPRSCQAMVTSAACGCTGVTSGPSSPQKRLTSLRIPNSPGK